MYVIGSGMYQAFDAYVYALSNQINSSWTTQLEGISVIRNHDLANVDGTLCLNDLVVLSDIQNSNGRSIDSMYSVSSSCST